MAKKSAQQKRKKQRQQKTQSKRRQRFIVGAIVAAVVLAFFRHFPVITRQSPKAAEAGQCAAEQGRLWDFHDYIYEQIPQGALAVDQLKTIRQILDSEG